MYPRVKDFFREFNEPFEGAIAYMYQDIKGLVTVGVGILIDPISEALILPFSWKNKKGVKSPGARATRQEIADEWNTIKNDATLAKKGHTACEPITSLELTNDEIEALIETRLNQN